MTKEQSDKLHWLLRDYARREEMGGNPYPQEMKIRDHIDALVAEARAPLVALLRELAEDLDLGMIVCRCGCGRETCGLCKQDNQHGSIDHTPECPVTRARALLANEGGERP